MISPAESQNVDLVESPGGWELPPPIWRDTIYRVYRGKDTKLQLESIRIKHLFCKIVARVCNKVVCSGNRVGTDFAFS